MKTLFLIDSFKTQMAGSESSNNYTIENSIGALGKYQFMPSTITRVANHLKITVPTKQQFLSTPALQELFMTTLMNLNLVDLENKGLLNYIGQPIKGKNKFPQTANINVYGLLGGAHLGGVGGVQELLFNKNDRSDSNGTYISDYIAKFSYLMDIEKKKFFMQDFLSFQLEQ
jgi:hypothetical protein